MFSGCEELRIRKQELLPNMLNEDAHGESMLGLLAVIGITSHSKLRHFVMFTNVMGLTKTTEKLIQMG